jgi:hypothetical protein
MYSGWQHLDIFIRGVHKFEFNSRQPTIWEKRSESEKFEYFSPEASVENAEPLFAICSESGLEMQGHKQLGAMSEKREEKEKLWASERKISEIL